MKCKKCNHKYKLESAGMGYSDPPGIFFWASIIVLVISALLLYFGHGLWHIAGYVGLIILFLCIASVIAGILDQQVYDISKCPKCGHKPKIRPWSS